MILIYKGVGPYTDPRFIAQPGDKVEFTDGEAKLKMEQEPELWEEVAQVGDRGQGRRGVRSDG